MNSAPLDFSHEKARLVARCQAERELLSSTCEDLRQSMTWWDMGYSVATTFAPQAKLLLPVLALAMGSQVGPLGKAGSLFSKVMMGWRMFSKSREIFQSLKSGSFLGR
jgi:hypothetical protein